VPAAVTVHVGTQAVPARLVRDGEYAQLRLESAVVAARGDRVVLRADTTVGGGTVLDPAPPRRLDRSRLEALERGDAAAFVHAPVPRATLRRLFSDDALEPLPAVGELVYSHAWLAELRESVHARLAARAAASPLDPGLPIAELLPEHPWALPLVDVERQGTKAYLAGATAALGDRAAAAESLEARLAEEEIVRVEDRDLSAYLESEGRLRRVGDGYAVSPALHDRGVEALQSLQPITLAAFRDALGVGRRTAQLLLERYDADGLTVRRGDERFIRRKRE
jgi:selenocysteine-specific elongation factor